VYDRRAISKWFRLVNLQVFLCGYLGKIVFDTGHRGIVHAAKWLERELRDDMIRIAQEHPEYAVTLTGHSLGAGAASLLAILLKSDIPRLHCYAFATPASLTLELAQSCQDYVTSIVCGDDCVPRLNQHNLIRLQGEVILH